MHKEELIEQYFRGQISDDGFMQIKALLETDAAFKKEFYSQLEIQQAIGHDRRVILKDRLAKLETKSAWKSNWYVYAAAAAILIIMGWFFYPSQPDYAKLYVANFDIYPNVVAPTVRDQQSSERNLMFTAFSFYDNQRFEDARAAFEELYQTTGEDYAVFYGSISSMALGDTQKAITALENHSWTNVDEYQTIVHWYVGLGYLKLQNKDMAVVFLRKVASTKDPVAEQAAEVLSKLE